MQQTTNWPTRLRRPEVPPYLKDRHGIKLAAQSLARMAVGGSGPSFSKLGRVPYYSTADLDAWVRERLSAPAPSTAAHKLSKKAA